jgi:hypothetical protein
VNCADRSSAIPVPVFYLPGINGLLHIWQFFVVNVPIRVENNTGPRRPIVEDQASVSRAISA